MALAAYKPHGVAAILPSALGLDFPVAPPRANYSAGNGVVIVSVSGPLTFAECGFDTYGAIGARFADAVASSPRAIVLAIDSPGGDVAGGFDLARDMRRRAALAKVPLVAFSGSQCCSAGYALACAASRIFCSDVATIGSIGVIAQVADVSAAEAAAGLKFVTITSGERKADGNPHAPITNAARAALQTNVDEMARVFFEHVASSRSQLTASDAEALEAGVRVGRAAVAAGLADGVTNFSELLASLS